MSDSSDNSPESADEENLLPDLDLQPSSLANLSADKRAELIQLVSQIEVYASFSGPLPPPNVLNLYDSDARKAIVSGFTANGNHRRASESRGQIFFFVRDILSLLVAFVLALIVVTGSIKIIQQGQSIEGLLGIGGTVAVISGAFLFRDRNQRKNRQLSDGDPAASNTEKPD